jgi:hypothetical protein
MRIDLGSGRDGIILATAAISVFNRAGKIPQKHGDAIWVLKKSFVTRPVLL